MIEAPKLMSTLYIYNVFQRFLLQLQVIRMHPQACPWRWPARSIQLLLWSPGPWPYQTSWHYILMHPQHSSWCLTLSIHIRWKYSPCQTGLALLHAMVSLFLSSLDLDPGFVNHVNVSRPAAWPVILTTLEGRIHNHVLYIQDESTDHCIK